MARLPLPEAMWLTGGAAFFVLLLLKPVLTLYVLIPLIPFSPFFGVSAGGIRVGMMEIVLLTGSVAWLMQLAVRQPPQRPLFPPLLWPFLVMIAAVALSWLNTLSLGASLVETIKWVEMLGLYLLVVALVPARQVKWVVLVILLVGMALALLGLYQFVFKIGPEGFLLYGGRFLRAYGTFAQPNPYGGYLGLILPLALAIALWSWFASNSTDMPVLTGLKPKILRLGLATLPLGLMAAALFAAQSRGAWLGFLAAGAVTLAIYNSKSAAILAMTILTVAVIALAGTFSLGVASGHTTYSVITQRLIEAGSIFTITDITSIEVTDANFATVERLAHWQAAREMWRDNLWLGVGFGNYGVVYPAYAPGRWLDPLGHAHNYLLNIGAEAGLVGLTGYLIFWISVFALLWQTVSRNRNFEKAVVVGAVGIMVHLHVHNLFDNLYVQGMYLHIAIILGLASVICQKVDKRNNSAHA
jgi:O-antigen ligase